MKSLHCHQLTHAFCISSFYGNVHFLMKYDDTSGYTQNTASFGRLLSFQPTSDISLAIIVRNNRKSNSDVTYVAINRWLLPASLCTRSKVTFFVSIVILYAGKIDIFFYHDSIGTKP